MIIKIKVRAGYKFNKLEKTSGGFIAYIKERAENGRANLELIKLLSEELNVNWRSIKIKNPTNRNKIVEIKEDK